MADVGLGQHRRDGYEEAPAVTLGQDLDGARRLLDAHPHGWSATQAVDFLLEHATVHATPRHVRD